MGPWGKYDWNHNYTKDQHFQDNKTNQDQYLNNNMSHQISENCHSCHNKAYNQYNMTHDLNQSYDVSYNRFNIKNEFHCIK